MRTSISRSQRPVSAGKTRPASPLRDRQSDVSGSSVQSRPLSRAAPDGRNHKITEPLLNVSGSAFSRLRAGQARDDLSSDVSELDKSASSVVISASLGRRTPSTATTNPKPTKSGGGGGDSGSQKSYIWKSSVPPELRDSVTNDDDSGLRQSDEAFIENIQSFMKPPPRADGSSPGNMPAVGSSLDGGGELESTSDFQSAPAVHESSDLGELELRRAALKQEQADLEQRLSSPHNSSTPSPRPLQTPAIRSPASSSKPVVKASPKSKSGEDALESRAQWKAAVVVQRWYRRVLNQRKERAKLKGLLSERKRRLEQNSMEEEERRRAEEKAREEAKEAKRKQKEELEKRARQEAIERLQKTRERRKQEQQQQETSTSPPEEDLRRSTKRGTTSESTATTVGERKPLSQARSSIRRSSSIGPGLGSSTSAVSAPSSARTKKDDKSSDVGSVVSSASAPPLPPPSSSTKRSITPPPSSISTEKPRPKQPIGVPKPTSPSLSPPLSEPTELQQSPATSPSKQNSAPLPPPSDQPPPTATTMQPPPMQYPGYPPPPPYGYPYPYPYPQQPPQAMYHPSYYDPSTAMAPNQSIGHTFPPGILDPLQSKAMHMFSSSSRPPLGGQSGSGRTSLSQRGGGIGTVGGGMEAGDVGSVVTMDPMRMSSEKISSILDYLNEVEASGVPSPRSAISEAVSLKSTPFTMATDFTSVSQRGPLIPDNTSVIATSVIDGVKAKMSALQSDLEQRGRTVEELREKLKRSKEREEQLKKASKESEKRKLESQRTEMEGVINRHLSFIDKLIADKEELTKRCDRLAEDMKAMDAKVSKKLEENDEKWAREIKRQKDAWAAAEKGRRDQWMTDKTKEIKETTVKGLEPEIQRLIAKHKVEINRLTDVHEEDLRKQREQLAAQHERSMQDLRDRMARDFEDQIQRERETARARLRDQSERYEQQAQEQRSRVSSEVQLERERMDALLRKTKQEYEEALDRAKRQEALSTKEFQEKMEEAKQELARRHGAEVVSLRSKWEIEKEVWQDQFIKKTEAEFKEREKAQFEKMSRERDEEIEMVLHRLEDETLNSRAAVMKEHEAKLREQSEKHSAELQSLRDDKQRLSEKYMAAVRAQATSENEVKEARALAESKQRVIDERAKEIEDLRVQLGEARSKLGVLGREREAESAKQTQVAEEAKRAAEEQLSQLREELVRSETAHQAEITELRRKKAAELDQVNVRVRQTISKKDDTIQQLREQLQMSEMRLRQTEMLLEKQRRELLG